MKLKIYSLALAASLVLFSSCSKDDDTTTNNNNNNNNNNTSITIDSSPQMRATIDGSAVSVVVDGTTNAESFSTSGSIATPPDSSDKQYTTYFEDANTSAEKFNMKIGTLKYLGGMIVPTTDYKNYFHTGTRSFSPGGTNGIELEWTDGAGTKWSTGLGAATQTGSLFTISTNKEYTLGYQRMKILATFNCKLYNGSGQSKTLTGGTLVIEFENN